MAHSAEHTSLSAASVSAMQTSVMQTDIITFPFPTLSSARSGRCSRISMGSVSAAITTNSEIPRLSVLVAAQQTPLSTVSIAEALVLHKFCL